LATENTPGFGLEISAEPHLCALSERYASRGLAKAVRDNAEEQILREEMTRAAAPEAYRLSGLSEAAVAGRYRRGKDSMDAEDLLRYFAETRDKRVEGVDFSQCEAAEARESEDMLPVKAEPSGAAAVKQLPERLKTALPAVCQRIKEGAPTWFDASAADTSANRRRFPLSAFAAIVAIAVSLMLIVASNVMLTRAESKVSQLTLQIDALAGEVAELQADLDVKCDLLTVRDVAVNEYGMVDEEYLKMDYISLQGEDRIEVFEEEREEAVGLSALLSAIGVK